MNACPTLTNSTTRINEYNMALRSRQQSGDYSTVVQKYISGQDSGIMKRVAIQFKKSKFVSKKNHLSHN